MPSSRNRLVIMGAGGRDFHNFNMVCRSDPSVEVVAFTATQIPGIDNRRYPASLAGPLYPDGIPILAEDGLEELCRREGVQQIVFAYSDVTAEHVMAQAARANALGCDFILLGPEATMLSTLKPVIAVSAVRTGCGKSQTARYIAAWLRDQGLKAGVLRHPMPYGDLGRQAVQRFASRQDLADADCTIEEREEYEPYIEAGGTIFAGVDYAKILNEAEREADIVVWDGGNNDFPFLRPDLHLVVVDALRPTHITGYYPGEATLRMADAVIINKVDAAPPDQVEALEAALEKMLPSLPLIQAASPVRLETADPLSGKKVIVVDDGPTITHGGMPFGAGYTAARAAGAEIVDPKPYAAPEIAAVYDRYPHIGAVLPAVGYFPAQLTALEATIRAASPDAVVSGTPIDLAGVLDVDAPVIRARYGYADAGPLRLATLLEKFIVQAERARP
ncbi:MAG: cyclic 2,3-diphosphoglycerate synthase [Alphaproteobacteria bacterium]